MTVAGQGEGGKLLALDLKLKAPVDSSGVPAVRGAAVALGNTRPGARVEVLGLRERGCPSDGTFNPRTGRGYVKEVKGPYHRALHVSGVDVRPALFETFGGWSPEVVELLDELLLQRQNKLRKDEYEVTTWSARTWLSFSAQKISCALQTAVAFEIAHALGLSKSTDVRD